MASGRGSRLRVIGALSTVSLLLASCSGPVVYQPPPDPPSTDFSQDLDGSYDQAWSAVTYVAGSTFYNIKNFDKGSGLMTLEYSDLRGGPGPYVSCGTMTGGLPAMGIITPEPNSVLNHFATYMSMSGRANITVRARGAHRATVQINSQYTLLVFGGFGDDKRLVGEWRFTSREADTQTINTNFQRTAVTCRPSYKIEREFLTEVAARL